MRMRRTRRASIRPFAHHEDVCAAMEETVHTVAEFNFRGCVYPTVAAAVGALSHSGHR